MVIRKSEFALALNQVATERGIPIDEVLDSIRQAVKIAYKKEYEAPEEEEYEVTINPDSGEARVFKDEKDVTPPGFGRIAAQTAKQVIIQKIREAEKKAVVQFFVKQVDTLVSGRVIRTDGKNVFVDIGRAEAVLLPSEQIRGEKYFPNSRLLFYLKEVNSEDSHYRIIISRRHENLIRELFKREVPELAQGVVQIKKLVREAGDRTKICVFSKEKGVDPVGSCVGQRGVRIQAVINSLGVDEKIDVIQWSNDPKTMIVNAISPSKTMEVVLDEDNKKADLFVDSDELSLIIGREGQNIRLASMLTGYTLNALPKGTTPIETK
ncbi:MAG: transcription termination factor NusA [Patescibacteria group bacterium]|jgi:N utilization substance protein A